MVVRVENPLSAYEWPVSKTVMAARLPRISLHGLRHTCATVALRNGTPPHVVAAILGQDVKVLLSTYAHVLAEQEDDAAATLARAFLGDASR